MILKGSLVFIIFMKIATCEDGDVEALQIKMTSKSKNPLPYFRRIVEEVPEDSTIESQTDDSSNLVAILVNNAKAIFDEVGEVGDGSIIRLHDNSLTTNELFEFDPTSSTTTTTEQDTTTEPTLYQPYSPLTTLLDQNLIEPLLEKDDIEKTLKSELLHLTKRMKSHEKSDREMEDADTTKKFLDLVLFQTTSEQPKVTTEEKEDRDDIEEGKHFIEESKNSNDEDEIQSSDNRSSPFRSCISCDNVFAENCDFPEDKIVPTTVCPHEGDLCYSQHTPFGIVDRGCFNVNHNLTTFVCSCNLCNYIAMSEMPYIFMTKQHWFDNVVELSRTRPFKKSVFKDMSCLRCEVNSTKTMADMTDAANCLEGNIGTLQIQDCEENEICAVKSVKNDGYVWRGCVRKPLYNYWWALCDSDLCNHEPIVSIYDNIREVKVPKFDSSTNQSVDNSLPSSFNFSLQAVPSEG